MSGGGKGGSQTTEIEIPDWLEREARRNINIARDVASQGFVPYYGPDVAALSPMQQAAMQNTGEAASAFGMASPDDPMAGMPQPQTFAGGVQGYSSGGLFDQALSELQERRPGQYDAVMRMFVDPVTGEQPSQPFGNGGGQPSGGAGVPSIAMSMWDGRGSPGFIGGGSSFQGPSLNGQAGYGPGGYTGIGDMFDGGGPGTSGSTFQGGGMVSNIGNAILSPIQREGGGGIGGGGK